MGKVKRQKANLKCKKGQSKKATGKKGKNGQSKEVKKRKKATLKGKKGKHKKATDKKGKQAQKYCRGTID